MRRYPAPGSTSSPVPSSSLVFRPTLSLHTTPPLARLSRSRPRPTFFGTRGPASCPAPFSHDPAPPPFGLAYPTPAPSPTRQQEAVHLWRSAPLRPAGGKLKSLACLHSERTEVWGLVFTSANRRSRNKHIHPKSAPGAGIWLTSPHRHHHEGRVFPLILQSFPFLNMG
ncbi:hypothetical protein NN561_015193 [Cricetulus griseus]